MNRRTFIRGASVRIPRAILARVEALLPRVSHHGDLFSHLKPNKTALVRAALVAGLDKLEREYAAGDCGECLGRGAVALQADPSPAFADCCRITNCLRCGGSGQMEEDNERD
jgi:hypothetical protein